MSEQTRDFGLDETLLAAELKRLRTSGLRRRSNTVAIPTLEAVARLLGDAGASINDQIKAAVDAGSQQMSELRGLAIRELLDAGNRKDDLLKQRRAFVADKLRITPKHLEAYVEDQLIAELARSLIRLGEERCTASKPATPTIASPEPSIEPRLARRRDGLVLKRPLRRYATPALVLAFVAVAALASTHWLVGNALSLPREELARLASESEHPLVGDQAPVPGSVSRLLGFGDPTPQGRTVYPYVAHSTEGGLQTQHTPASLTPTLNVLTDVTFGIGDERQFMHLATGTPKRPLAVNITARSAFLRHHEKLWLKLYIDNGASPEPNCSKLVGSTIAKHTTVRVATWDSPNKRLHIIRGWVYAENATPTWITDAVAIITEKPTTLELIPSHSSQYSELPTSAHLHRPLTSRAIVEPSGIPLGSNGLLGSCWQNRFDVFLLFRQD